MAKRGELVQGPRVSRMHVAARPWAAADGVCRVVPRVLRAFFVVLAVVTVVGGLAADAEAAIRRRDPQAPGVAPRKGALVPPSTPPAPTGPAARTPALRSASVPMRQGGQTRGPDVQDDGGYLEDNLNAPSGTPWTCQIRDGNDVKPLVDGPAIVTEICRIIRTAKGPGHFIYIAGWNVGEGNAALSAYDANGNRQAIKVLDLLKAAAGRGVRVRILLNPMRASGPADVVDASADGLELQSRPVANAKLEAEQQRARRITASLRSAGGEQGRACVDARLLEWGSHHQKMVVVYGEQGLLATVGSLDLCEERLNVGMWGEVSCSIRGPAAADICETFTERWNSLPGDVTHGDVPATPSIPSAIYGACSAQVTRTYGSLSDHRSMYGTAEAYPFAPNGETSIRAQVVTAIRAARTSIYVEDQYFWDDQINDELRRVLGSPGFKGLVIFVPKQSGIARLSFLYAVKNMAAEYPDKIHLLVAEERYLPHGKVWIIDDRVAILGSANCNRRSFTHDSEIDVGVTGGGFALALRKAIWQQHLGVDPQLGYGPEVEEAFVSARAGSSVLRPGDAVAEYAQSTQGPRPESALLLGAGLPLLLGARTLPQALVAAGMSVTGEKLMINDPTSESVGMIKMFYRYVDPLGCFGCGVFKSGDEP